MANYTPTGNPTSQSRGVSSLIRNEFALIQTAIATKSGKDESNTFTLPVTFGAAVTFSANTTFNALATYTAGATYSAGTYNFTSATITVPTKSARDSSTNAASTKYVDDAVSAASFATALPSQTGNAGKFVTTDGSTASWATPGVASVVTATGNTTLTNTPTLLKITPTGPGVTVKLPDATTCAKVAPLHCIDNQSGYPIRVTDNTGTLLGFAPPKTPTYIDLNDNSTSAGVWGAQLSKVGWAAGYTIPSSAAFAGTYYAAVALDSDRTFLVWRGSTAYYACVYRQSTNAFTSPTVVRTATTSYVNAILCGTNSVLVVTCVATAVEGVVVSVNASTDALTINTAATLTLSANLANAGFGTLNALVSVPGASGSYAFVYSTVAPAAQVVALTVSGTTVTFGTPTTLSGTATSAPYVLASGDKIVTVSYTGSATFTGYCQVFTVSGTTLSAGTGVNVSNVNGISQFLAWGSRFLVLWMDNTSLLCTASLLSLSGTTLTASTVTSVIGLNTVTATDVCLVGASKALVAGAIASPSTINLLTDTSGTLSAGTGISNSNQKGIAAVIGTDVILYDAGTSSVIDCSGSSPVTTRAQAPLSSSGFGAASGAQQDGYSYSGAILGSSFRITHGGPTQGNLQALDGYNSYAPIVSCMPQYGASVKTTIGYRNRGWSFSTTSLSMLECVA